MRGLKKENWEGRPDPSSNSEAPRGQGTEKSEEGLERQLIYEVERG